MSQVKRKLAAILAADVQGYSRLMGEDEVATLRTLTASREVTDALIAQYHGRIVNTAGDSILAEFASVVDAVQCAVDIQRELQTKNAELPETRRMAFRIGINLGDVMVEGEQIYGDGVNIAARLENLADGGGICLAGNVYEQIRHKLPLRCEDLGEQRVKNIAEPVRVYRIVIEVPSPSVEQASSLPAARMAASPKERRAGSARHWAGVAGLFIVTGIAVTVWHFTRPSLSTQDSVLRTDAAPAALPLPDKPSIVILPFVNMSEDPKQEYFSDGITEVLTGDLSKISSLFVIARNTAFTYKGKAVNVQEVGRELGVQYVLEGSVQRADNEVRVTARLIDVTTGGHLWSERYDRPLKGIFALQDDIVQKIVTTLNLQLTLRENGFLVSKRTDNVEAYDYYLRGLEAWARVTKDENAKAIAMFEKAVELDPTYAEPYSRQASCYLFAYQVQWSNDPQALDHAFELAQKALALDNTLSQAHSLLSVAYRSRRQYDEAIAEAERAVALDPNNADGYGMLAQTLSFTGKPQEALKLLEKAMRLNPRYLPYYNWLGYAYRLTGRYEEAIGAFKTFASRFPDAPNVHLNLAALYSELGREAEAQAEVAEILRINPHFSLEAWTQRIPFKDPAVTEQYVTALRKAGLK